MDVEFYLLKTAKKLNKKRKRKTFVFHLCPSKHLNVGRWISKYPLTRLKAFLVKIEKQTKSISLRGHFDVWQIVNWRYSVAIGLHILLYHPQCTEKIYGWIQVMIIICASSPDDSLVEVFLSKLTLSGFPKGDKTSKCNVTYKIGAWRFNGVYQLYRYTCCEFFEKTPET